MNGKHCSAHSIGQVPPAGSGPTNAAAPDNSPVALEVVRPDPGIPMQSAGTSTGKRMLSGPLGEILSYAAVALSGMCLEVAADISPPRSFPSTSQHLSLNHFSFSLFCLELPHAGNQGRDAINRIWALWKSASRSG